MQDKEPQTPVAQPEADPGIVSVNVDMDHEGNIVRLPTNTTSPSTAEREAQRKVIVDRGNSNVTSWRTCYDRISSTVPYSDEKPLRDEIAHANRVIEILYRDLNSLAAIISKHCIPQHRYHCSCGAACTAEEYIEHFFEKGHDRADLNLDSRYREGREAERMVIVPEKSKCLHCSFAIYKSDDDRWYHAATAQTACDGVYLSAKPVYEDPIARARAEVSRLNSEVERLTKFLDDAHVRNAEDQDEHSEQRAKLVQQLATTRADAIGEAIEKAQGHGEKWELEAQDPRADLKNLIGVRARAKVTAANEIAAALEQLKGEG